MSVKVEGLTKVYGEQLAVNNVSFEARKGEVLGFLGPNGAGKTTTMKVVTCFIPQNEGTVTVSGFDTATQSKEVRERIGYLPEHNPLYKDMYVKEYLSFVAGLHHIADKQKRISEMIDLTGLGDEQNKQIGALSKGYRQRVGLAQAMIHDPEVLILDEPTSGLDPNQLVDIRALITEFGKHKTVIFSTHIMQEVQAICDRVLIINKGKLVANDSIEELQQRVKGVSVVTVQFLEKVNAKQLKSIPGVKSVKDAPNNQWRLSGGSTNDIRPAIFKYAVEQGLTMIEMRKEMFSIESVFQQLTKEK